MSSIHLNSYSQHPIRNEIQTEPSKILSITKRIAVYTLTFFDVIADIFQTLLEEPSDQEEESMLKEIDSVYSASNIENNYAAKVQKVQWMLTKKKGKRNSISKETITKIFQYIDTHRVEWEEQSKKENQNIYIHSSLELPRSVQFNLDGSIFIHFNRRVKAGNDKLLGEGHTKNVSLAMEYNTGTWFASSGMKSFNAEKEIKKHQIVKGIEGVVQLHSYVKYISKKGIKKTRLITTLYERGELFNSVQHRLINREEKIQIAISLLKIISKMHEEGILHRDLKLENVCLDKDYHPHIIDIETCCHINDWEDRADFVGTMWYMSPEYANAFLNLDFFEPVTTTKNDDWAMGCLLFSMFSGFPIPWSKYIETKTLDEDSKALKIALETICNLKEAFPEPSEKESISHIIWGLLQLDPSKRITSKQALERFLNSQKKATIDKDVR